VLLLNAQHRYRISQISRYDTFDQLADRESISAIAPGLDRSSFLLAAHEIYPPKKEALVVCALEIRPDAEADHEGRTGGKAAKYSLRHGSCHGCPPRYCFIRFFMTALS